MANTITRLTRHDEFGDIIEWTDAAVAAKELNADINIMRAAWILSTNITNK